MPPPMSAHGGSRKGSGRKPSADTQAKRQQAATAIAESARSAQRMNSFLRPSQPAPLLAAAPAAPTTQVEPATAGIQPSTQPEQEPLDIGAAGAAQTLQSTAPAQTAARAAQTLQSTAPAQTAARPRLPTPAQFPLTLGPTVRVVAPTAAPAGRAQPANPQRTGPAQRRVQAPRNPTPTTTGDDDDEGSDVEGEGDNKRTALTGGARDSVLAHQNQLKKLMAKELRDDGHVLISQRKQFKKEVEDGQLWRHPPLPNAASHAKDKHAGSFCEKRYFNWLPHLTWPGSVRCPKCKESGSISTYV